jgi:hypothetical protein
MMLYPLRRRGLRLETEVSSFVSFAIDVPLIYGDFFFAEGIAQLVGYKELFW